MPSKQGLSSLDDGFRVRYLGSLGFTGGSRKPGIQTLQRPMLQLYSTARRKGEDQRSRHPLALNQFLDVSNYGLVVVDIEEDPEDGELTPVITKVITPIENVIMWAAVRFHARPTKRRSMGAAFVPIACSDGVLDKNSFIQLGSKQRFLVSLSHPPLFVCLLQSVASPKSVECHAFVCASAEDSLSICSMVSGSKEERVPSAGTLSYYTGPRSSRAPSSQTYRSRSRGDASNSEEDVLSTITPSSLTTMTEGTNSHLTVDSSRGSRVVLGRREAKHNGRSLSCPRPTDDSSLEYAEFARDNPSPVLGRRYTNGLEKSIQTPRLSKRFVHSGYYDPPPKPPRGLRTKTLHRDKSPSPNTPEVSTSSTNTTPTTDYHKILMRLDMREDSSNSEYEKKRMSKDDIILKNDLRDTKNRAGNRLPITEPIYRNNGVKSKPITKESVISSINDLREKRMSNNDLSRTGSKDFLNNPLSDYEKIRMRIPPTINGKEDNELKLHPLPSYQFGQTEKSFQTMVEDSPSRNSSDKSDKREMVTVSHTVDFSSEAESGHNGYDTEEERKRNKEIRRRKNNLVNNHLSLTRKEVPQKSSMGTMTEKRTWSQPNNSETEDSDNYHRRFHKHETSVKQVLNNPRIRRDSLEMPSGAEMSSESDLNGPMDHPKYIRNGGNSNNSKGVWVHPSVFMESEASRPSYEREYVKKPNGFQVRSDYTRHDPDDEEILGNGTSRVTITVPYYRDSASSQMSSASYPRNSHHPHGVRSFHRSDQVRNWSTVSVTSDQSYQGSSTLPMVRVPKSQNNKVIRWSSVERLPRKRNLFTTIKRFSVRSLTRAKQKTGQLLNSLKTKMKTEKQKKSSDTNSQDSAYDTAEVCLRPDGSGNKNALKKAKRRQSWSFHDLRTEFPTGRPGVQKRHQHGSNHSLNLNGRGTGSPAGSGKSASSARELVTRKKKRKQHSYSRTNSNDSSDSGVEEYPSDYSEAHRRANNRQLQSNGNGLANGRHNLNRRAESDPENLASEAHLASVNHGRSHGRRNYSRWSQTDLHGELGYIP